MPQDKNIWYDVIGTPALETLETSWDWNLAHGFFKIFGSWRYACQIGSKICAPKQVSAHLPRLNLRGEKRKTLAAWHFESALLVSWSGLNAGTWFWAPHSAHLQSAWTRAVRHRTSAKFSDRRWPTDCNKWLAVALAAAAPGFRYENKASQNQKSLMVN